MANFIVAVDRNEVRRDSFIELAKRNVSPIPGLSVAELKSKTCAVAWAANSNAPISIHREFNDQDQFSVVWGTPFDCKGVLSDASHVHVQAQSKSVGQYNGFYCSLSVLANGRVSVSADVLGLFPVYYWSRDGITLVSSSIELIRKHPEYCTSIDPQGLAGVLLSNGLIHGRTLFYNIYRLNARHELNISEMGVEEVEIHSIESSSRKMDLPFEGYIELISGSFREACKRQFQVSDDFGIFLSGGLDSRMLAGELDAQGKIAKAITFGQAADSEAIFAKRVANSLDMPHKLFEVSQHRYYEAAQNFVTWDSLSSGYSAIPDWIMAHSADLPKYTVMGHVLDGVIGGLHVDWAYDQNSNVLSAENFLSALSGWAFSPQQLEYILDHRSFDAMHEVRNEFKRDYESTSSLSHIKAWHADLSTRQRFHVGIAIWITSFRSWPIVPALDVNLLSNCADLPGSALFHRRAQIGTLIRLYPKLAALKVDRNSSNTSSLTPRIQEKILDYSKLKTNFLANKLRIPTLKNGPRFYDRLYNLNSKGWRDIRLAVEQNGYRFPMQVSHKRALDFIPNSNTTIKFKDPIKDSGRVKLLLGLALLSSHIGLTQ